MTNILFAKQTEIDFSPFTPHSSQKSAPILTPSHKRYSIVCSAESHKGRKYAFTLAEVLITLGIIGIVAALTMPSLMANYQKKVLVTQLKKQVNVINNNFRRIMADEGVDQICDTSIAAGDCRNGSVSIDPNLYKKYFGLDYASDSGKTANLIKFGGADIVLQTKDGAILSIYETIVIDVNGDKGPNKAGHDRFVLATDEIIDFKVNDEYANNCTADFSEDFKDYDDDTKSIASWLFTGSYCFHRIIKDGWQMKY